MPVSLRMSSSSRLPGRRAHPWLMMGLLGVVGGLASPALMAFDFEDVAQKARSLSETAYAPPETELPDALRDLEYEEYAQIQYRGDQALWADEELPFELTFFHEGMHFDSAVKVHTVEGDEVSEVAFDPSAFDYGELSIPEEQLEGLGFSGLKILNALNQEEIMDEVMVFQGASYFRALGREHQYGLSGRGLAVDTALQSGEEFPAFREFWVVKPTEESQYLTVFALLDSPSLSGAYRFVLRPGDDTVVDVKSRLFLRREVEKLGIAPLTSMYLFGPGQPAESLNYRPAIHDSNGLLVQDEADGWSWRPLVNPARLMIEEAPVESLGGFGLLQRSHDFDDYEDLVDRYDRRPSTWIEPQGDWGAGVVELIQIPTPNETNDNIVAFWKPESLPPTGEPLDLSYRMHWTTSEAKFLDPELAWVDETRRSRGEVRRNDLVREPDGSLAFVLDFTGPVLEGYQADDGLAVEAGVDDNGELIDSRVVPNPAEGGWRVFLRVKRADDDRPMEIRATLKDGETPLSETWLYRLPAHE